MSEDCDHRSLSEACGGPDGDAHYCPDCGDEVPCGEYADCWQGIAVNATAQRDAAVALLRRLLAVTPQRRMQADREADVWLADFDKGEG